ncbi:hypothetical protein ANN_13331 [Periplaneta americana]|uniref:HAT C-terminal dimerisation domain-containing protein n=1 Tax=Periplaneta americana TaxID=6978 RepID=A0ABQ8TJ41_PERAM|nr:hypothetical protein ANN_13331 [Periplaneta americana]
MSYVRDFSSYHPVLLNITIILINSKYQSFRYSLLPQYADIVYVYGLFDGSSLRAVAEYERRFPNRRIPYRRVLIMGLDERLEIRRSGRLANFRGYVAVVINYGREGTTAEFSVIQSSLADFDRTISSLTSVSENVGDKVNEKTANILSKNPGYYQLKEIQDILEGKTPQKPTKFSIVQLTAFVRAPLTSCDVERSFSRYKAMLRDNRRRMTTENIRHCLVVNCNSINGAFSNEASTSKS